MENIELWECIEICSYCGEENVIEWNTDKMGYVIKCQHCGEKIFLCDECLNSPDNGCMYCDWRETETGNECFRGEITNNK